MLQGDVREFEPDTQPVRFGLVPLQKNLRNGRIPAEGHERHESGQLLAQVLRVPRFTLEIVAVAMQLMEARLVFRVTNLIAVHELIAFWWHMHLLDVQQHFLACGANGEAR